MQNLSGQFSKGSFTSISTTSLSCSHFYYIQWRTTPAQSLLPSVARHSVSQSVLPPAAGSLAAAANDRRRTRTAAACEKTLRRPLGLLPSSASQRPPRSLAAYSSFRLLHALHVDMAASSRQEPSKGRLQSPAAEHDHPTSALLKPPHSSLESSSFSRFGAPDGDDDGAILFCTLPLYAEMTFKFCGTFLWDSTEVFQ